MSINLLRLIITYQPSCTRDGGLVNSLSPVQQASPPSVFTFSTNTSGPSPAGIERGRKWTLHHLSDQSCWVFPINMLSLGHLWICLKFWEIKKCEILDRLSENVEIFLNDCISWFEKIHQIFYMVFMVVYPIMLRVEVSWLMVYWFENN